MCQNLLRSSRRQPEGRKVNWRNELGMVGGFGEGDTALTETLSRRERERWCDFHGGKFDATAYLWDSARPGRHGECRLLHPDLLRRSVGADEGVDFHVREHAGHCG